ncbi:hypothetical protein HMPREF3293_01293 [Christensenella minuta]|uniref:Uncharacterized protein n=1 Tax=Christensenella minuta TaxID=626937 RepID=A0A136Q572_9FIRM|nr:hypothetical protein HMPREF3293_01293 [Christensenella minuta]
MTDPFFSLSFSLNPFPQKSEKRRPRYLNKKAAPFFCENSCPD